MINHFLQIKLIWVEELLDSSDADHDLNEGGEEQRKLPERILDKIKQDQDGKCLVNSNIIVL